MWRCRAIPSGDDWVDDPNRQATHEDYTVKLLVDSELTDLIRQQVGDLDISGEVLAALVMGKEEWKELGVSGIKAAKIVAQLTKLAK